LDVSLPSLAARVVADLRPAADALATARIDRPPLAVAVAAPLAVNSLSQEALVTRTVLDPVAMGATEGSADAPKRVLKPWGVPMLPWDTSSGDIEAEAPDDARATRSSDERTPPPVGADPETAGVASSSGLGSTAHPEPSAADPSG
jgi:hypothetical protein